MKEFRRLCLVPTFAAVVLVGGACGGNSKERSAYVQAIQADVAQLDQAAVSTRSTLNSIRTANQIQAAVGRLRDQQATIEEATLHLAAVNPPKDVTQAHSTLLDAIDLQRNATTTLVQALETTGPKGLATAERASSIGLNSKRKYAEVQNLLPELETSLDQADLTAPDGLKRALRQRTAQATATARREEAARRAADAAAAAAAAPRPTVPTGSSLTIAAARALTDESFRLINRGQLSEGEQMARQALERLSGSGDSYEGNALYNVGLSLLLQGRCSEATSFLASSLESGTAQQNVIRRSKYEQAIRCS